MEAFKLFRGVDNQFRFNLENELGRVVLISESYTSEAGRTTGIESVKVNSQKDGQYERLIGKDGSHYFNLKAGNGEIIGTSVMHPTAFEMEVDIETVKRLAV